MFVGGNVLLVYQIIHLLSPCGLRQKRISILIAIMHIGVGTQFIFDYKAFTILLASFFLIPRALYLMDSEYFTEDTAGRYSRKHFLERIVLACLMVLFFLVFPRFSFQARTSNQFLNSPGGGRLSEEVDMARSVGEGGSQLVLQIEGQDIGYLKCFALDEFDGVKWFASHWLKKQDGRFYEPDIDNSMSRSVRVFNFRVLGNCLPIDGFVQNLEANYPDRPYIAGDGSVKVGFSLRNNLSYVYWTKKKPIRRRLTPKARARYLEVLPQSDALTEWLETITGSIPNPEKQAQKLASYFRSEFTYKIGAPDLNRLNPLDDFIFNQREGHCERFASALAVLLRLTGIPSRVVVGFLPVENNELGDFYNIRVKHAHAWTEAYFDNQGWQIVDATPYGRSVRVERRPLAFTFFEWVEYVWYAKIVEFGTHDQRFLLNFTAGKFRKWMAHFVRISVIIFGGVAIALTVYLIYRINWQHLFSRLKRGNTHVTPAKEAHHFYARMLKTLGKENYVREASQTPIEFLSVLERKDHRLLEEIRLITTYFCQVFYGQTELSTAAKKQLKDALSKISKSIT